MFWSKPVTLWLFLSKVTLSLKGNTESVIFLVAFSAARWKENNFWVSQCYLPKIRSWCRSATCFTGESWVSVLLWKSELKVLQCYHCHRETMQFRVTCIESHFGLVSLSTPYIFDIDMSHGIFFDSNHHFLKIKEHERTSVWDIKRKLNVKFSKQSGPLMKKSKIWTWEFIFSLNIDLYRLKMLMK